MLHNSALTVLIIAISIALAPASVFAADQDNKQDNSSQAQFKDELVVTVNGTKIMESEVMSKVQQQVAGRLRQVPEAQRQQAMMYFVKQIRPQTIKTLVIETLLKEKVKEAGINVTKEEVDKEIEKMAQSQNMTMEDLKQVLQANGQDYQTFHDRIERGVSYQKFFESKMKGLIDDVNDKDIEKYYNENIEQFKTPQMVRASHILLSTDPKNADPNTDPNDFKAQQKAKAQKVLTMVKEGKDFAELAKQYSDCPSAQKGGDLGLNRREAWVPEFSEAAFALDPNEVSGIVETQFGYHIIKTTDKKPAKTSPLAEVKENIEMRITGPQKNEFVREYIEKVQEEADIEYAPGKEPQMPEPPTGRAPARGSSGSKGKTIEVKTD